MATFEEVIKQLQMNNRSEAGRDSRHTALLNKLNQTMEGVEAVGQRQEEKVEYTNAEIARLQEAFKEEQKQLKENGKLVKGSNKLNRLSYKIQEEQLKQKVREAGPSERKEAVKELKAFQAKQLSGLTDLGKSFKTAFSNIGKIKTGIPGLSLGLLAKLAVIPLLIKFLRSPVWDEIIGFIQDPSFEKLGELFSSYTVELTALTAIVAGYAIVKLVATATALASAFTAIGTGLTALGAVIGLSAGATGLVIVAVVAAIVVTAKALYDAFKVFSDTFKETGSIMESLKEAAIEFVGSLFSTVPTLFKNLTSYIARKLGFENFADTLDQFSIKDVVKNAVRDLFAGIGKVFKGVKDFFTADTIAERLDILFGGITSIADFMLTPVTFVYEKIQDLFSVAGFKLPDLDFKGMVSGAIENVKEKIKLAIENVKDTIPVPDFSEIGDKIAALAMFFSPTRLLNQVGDAIEAADFGVASFLKTPLLKIFGTTEQTAAKEAERKLQEDADVNMMHTGGFLSRGNMALVGERGPELIISDSPAQVLSEARTDQLGMAAVNKVMNGGGGMGSNVFVNTGGNTATNVTRNVSFRPSAHIDTNFDKYQKFA